MRTDEKDEMRPTVGMRPSTFDDCSSDGYRAVTISMSTAVTEASVRRQAARGGVGSSADAVTAPGRGRRRRAAGNGAGGCAGSTRDWNRRRWQRRAACGLDRQRRSAGPRAIQGVWQDA